MILLLPNQTSGIQRLKNPQKNRWALSLSLGLIVWGLGTILPMPVQAMEGQACVDWLVGLQPRHPQPPIPTIDGARGYCSMTQGDFDKSLQKSSHWFELQPGLSRAAAQLIEGQWPKACPSPAGSSRPLALEIQITALKVDQRDELEFDDILRQWREELGENPLNLTWATSPWASPSSTPPDLISDFTGWLTAQDNFAEALTKTLGALPVGGEFYFLFDRNRVQFARPRNRIFSIQHNYRTQDIISAESVLAQMAPRISYRVYELNADVAIIRIEKLMAGELPLSLQGPIVKPGSPPTYLLGI